MKIVSFITDFPTVKMMLDSFDVDPQRPEPLAHSPPLFQDTVCVPP